jgi:hypothetical protein
MIKWYNITTHLHLKSTTLFQLYILKKRINSALHRLWQYITVWCAGGCLVEWEVHTEHEARDADCFSSAVLIHHHLTQTFHNQPGSEPRIVSKCKFIINDIITCQEYQSYSNALTVSVVPHITTQFFSRLYASLCMWFLHFS